MKLFFITLLWLFTTFSSFAASIEKIVSIETGTGKLEGTLLTGDLKSSKTVALIIAGSGPTNRDGNNPTMINNSLNCFDLYVWIGINQGLIRSLVIGE